MGWRYPAASGLESPWPEQPTISISEKKLLKETTVLVWSLGFRVLGFGIGLGLFVCGLRLLFPGFYGFSIAPMSLNTPLDHEEVRFGKSRHSCSETLRIRSLTYAMTTC